MTASRGAKLKAKARERRRQRREARLHREDPRLKGRELLYDGRTLSLTIYLDTDEEKRDVVERLRGPLGGPKKVMILVAIRETPAGGDGLAFWAANQHLFDSPSLPRHGGRTLEVQAFLNTDEPLSEVHRRAQAAVICPRVHLALVQATDEVDPEHAAKMWKATWNAAERTVKAEN